MAVPVVDAGRSGRLQRLAHTLLHELRHVLPPTIFFFIGFNLILFTKRLILEQCLIQFAGFFIAATAALIVGKVVLVADKMTLLRRFDYAPLAAPILFKTVIYTLLVFAARLIEAFVHYVLEGGVVGHGGFIEHQLGSFSWSQFIATQMWIFVLFLVYVTGIEISSLLGDGELYKIFFTRRSSELKSTRRARIRQLIRLSRLTEAHSLETLGDPASGPHAELVAILRSLARGARQSTASVVVALTLIAAGPTAWATDDRPTDWRTGWNFVAAPYAWFPSIAWDSRQSGDAPPISIRASAISGIILTSIADLTATSKSWCGNFGGFVNYNYMNLGQTTL